MRDIHSSCGSPLHVYVVRHILCMQAHYKTVQGKRQRERVELARENECSHGDDPSLSIELNWVLCALDLFDFFDFGPATLSEQVP